MRVLRAADRAPTPWKNGGGVTREVAIWPRNAALGAFDWRISIADVAQSGPFSTFPGVDRALTVIDGDGLELVVEGSAPTTLAEGSAPYAFAGDAACVATLRRGPIRDLNLMVRRGVYVASVRRLEGPAVINRTAETTFVMALTATEIGGLLLDPEDVVLFERGASLNTGAGRLIVADIEPA